MRILLVEGSQQCHVTTRTRISSLSRLRLQWKHYRGAFGGTYARRTSMLGAIVECMTRWAHNVFMPTWNGERTLKSAPLVKAFWCNWRYTCHPAEGGELPCTCG